MDENRNNQVPKDYEELYNVYFAPGKLGPALCKRLLFGKQAQDWQDANQDAYLRLLSTDILAKFDRKKANFGGMIFVACRSACMNMGRKGVHELYHLSLTETSEERVPGVIAGDRIPDKRDEEAGAIARLEVERLRIKARAAASRSKAKRYQQQEQLIELLLDGNSIEECAGTLGVSRASVDLWVGVLAKGE